MNIKMNSERRRTQISRKVFEQPGYTADIYLSDWELSFFRQAITEQWIANIHLSNPDLSEQFKAIGVDRYHELDHLINHEKLWQKQSRVFSESTVRQLKAFPFMSKLKEEFGEFSISDVVYGNTVEKGREEIYWRLVRPHKPSDIGPIHADKWFHEAIGSGGVGMFPAGSTTVKIWLPIYCEPGLNGLIVVPDSHLRDWRYQLVSKNGTTRPIIEEDVGKLGGILVPTNPGTLLIFNERLLHGGAINNGETSRISVEITMVFY